MIRQNSLVSITFPGLLTIQFFDHKNEGGMSGSYYHMKDVSVHSRGEESPIKRTHFAHAFFVFNKEQYVFGFANTRNSSAWDRNYKIRPQLILLIKDP